MCEALTRMAVELDGEANAIEAWDDSGARVRTKVYHGTFPSKAPLSLVEVAAIFRELPFDPGLDVIAENLEPFDFGILDGEPGKVHVCKSSAG